ncbi:hypothetical protein K501DRAFT_282344 [Backusella circina FSU 941]|nr:hypothetical protein K501DRAFT_282344 [Backusella circina FSU 941]
MILRLVTEYIPDEDDPTFKHRFNTSDDYVESLHAKHPICKECQKKMDSLIEEQKEAERSRNFISRITYSLTTKPPKRPSRLSYLLQGLLYIWTHTVAIATLLYGYYYISNLLFTPPSWVQLDTIYSALDGLVELTQTPWSIDRIYQLLIIQTGQHVVYFFYNTYLLVYKVAMESKTRLDDWELEDFAFGFYIANIMSWVIIDWHPVTINTFVEEPGRVRNWHAYKMIQRLLYIARIGNLVLINHAADNAWILTALGCYLTLWLVSILMVRAPSRKRVTRTPIIKPLSGVLKQMLYGIYQTCRDNVIWIKKRLTFKWPVKKVIQEQQQQDHQSMDIDDDAIYQDQNRSEEEVERVATKMGYIRL